MGLFKFLKEKFSKKEKISTEKVSESQINEKKDENSSIEKYSEGLCKSRKEFANKLLDLSKKYSKSNAEYFEGLKRTLIEADCGVKFSLDVISRLVEISKKEKISETSSLNERLVDLLFDNYNKDGDVINNEISFSDGQITVALIMGVNGVGKTTSIAKLAYRYKNKGKKVLLIAGDTFRAGAVEQLKIWASRIGVDIISGNENEDPASVVFKGCSKAKENKYDLVIVDTAGRIQTKQNLMNELEKINKVITRELPNSLNERYLVLDATTGQNGVLQAKSFFESVNVTGIILTKMDGTSKGGIVLSIKNDLNIPVKFVGLGEKLGDLEPFDLEKFIYSLCIPEGK